MRASTNIEDEMKESLLYDESPKSSERCQENTRLRRWLIIVSIIASTFFCTTVLLAVNQPTASNCKNVFPTEFVSAAPGIDVEMIEKHFTNDLRFNATSQSFYNQELDPTETKYIGAPSPELDAAWRDLLHSQYVAISATEALQFPETSRQTINYHGEHNFFELSVFHNLHCLNEIRMAIDSDYYAKDPAHLSMWGAREHTDHCIDQIRQALECHSDLTPVPMLKVEGGPEGLYVGNGEVHTCRNFEKIRGWVEQRGKMNDALGE